MIPALFFQVRYLDFLDFGTILLQPTLPRVKVWKGDMMKEYIKLDMDEDNFYGNLNVIVFCSFLFLMNFFLIFTLLAMLIQNINNFYLSRIDQAYL